EQGIPEAHRTPPAYPRRPEVGNDAPQPEEGPLRRRPPPEEGGRAQREGREEGHQDLVAPVDDPARHGRPHDRRARRPQARPGVRHRVDGRPQARRVRPDPHVPVPRRPGAGWSPMTGLKTNERPGTRAQHRYARLSAYKARVVLDLIRGTTIAEADEILAFCERDAADVIRKVLDSAVANAEHNDEIPADELYVSACYADEGPTLKRWRPRARGRATRIRKRTCHITIIVSRLSADEVARMRAAADAARDARSGQGAKA